MWGYHRLAGASWAIGLHRAARVARQISWYWGTLLGDTHYRRYLEYRCRAHPGEPVLSERDYWRQRYDGYDDDPSARCC